MNEDDFEEYARDLKERGGDVLDIRVAISPETNAKLTEEDKGELVAIATSAVKASIDLFLEYGG